MATRKNQAAKTRTPAPAKTEDGAGQRPERGGAKAEGSPAREEFFIHPEILLGGAGYRRITSADPTPSGG